MEDFVDATEIVRQSDGIWTAEIRKDWALWGPSGGFLSALAMRAAGQATQFARPISFACQFLNRASFGLADLRVSSLKSGKRTEALRVEITQGDKTILTAMVWAGVAGSPGMEHDFAHTSSLPAPDSLKPYSEVYPEDPKFPFLERLGHRPIDPLPHKADLPVNEPEISGFYRLQPRARHEDPFVDAARIFLLVDTYAWLATYPAHPTAEASPWIAPNLDFYYRFHRSSTDHDWLHLKSRADIAEDGLIGAEGEIRAQDGRLIARGVTQLICYPRPPQL